MFHNDATDEDLMASYKNGSAEAYQMLYRRHSGKILGYLKARLKSEQMALDVFQDVFLKLHRSKHLYRTELPALPWIFTITHRVMLDGIRKLNRRKEIFDYDLEQIGASESEPGLNIDLDSLPLVQQKVLELRYDGNNSFEEIAKTLNTTPVNARKMVSRALIGLKKLAKGSSYG